MCQRHLWRRERVQVSQEALERVIHQKLISLAAVLVEETGSSTIWFSEGVGGWGGRAGGAFGVETAVLAARGWLGVFTRRPRGCRLAISGSPPLGRMDSTLVTLKDVGPCEKSAATLAGKRFLLSVRSGMTDEMRSLRGFAIADEA